MDTQDTAFEFRWSEKIAPRIGANLDVSGDGKLPLYGRWGRFYDWTKFRLARETFGAEIWKTYYRSLDALDVFSLGLNNLPGRDLLNPSVAGAFLDQRNPVAGLNSVDPNLKPMSQDQWSLGTDYQWSLNTILGARLIHQPLRRTVEAVAALVRGRLACIYATPSERLAQPTALVTACPALP